MKSSYNPAIPCRVHTHMKGDDVTSWRDIQQSWDTQIISASTSKKVDLKVRYIYVLECYSALKYENSVIYRTQRNSKGCYVKGNKPSTDEQICILTSIWNVKGLTRKSRDCRGRMVVMSRGKSRSMIKSYRELQSEG